MLDELANVQVDDSNEHSDSELSAVNGFESPMHLRHKLETLKPHMSDACTSMDIEFADVCTSMDIEYADVCTMTDNVYEHKPKGKGKRGHVGAVSLRPFLKQRVS